LYAQDDRACEILTHTSDSKDNIFNIRLSKIEEFQIIFAPQKLSEKNNFLKIINEHFQVHLLFEIFFEIHRKARILNTVI
jgi:hypothetical protein